MLLYDYLLHFYLRQSGGYAISAVYLSFCLCTGLLQK